MPDDSRPAERKRGGQPGNNNAIKHGKYSDLYFNAMNSTERRALAVAREMSLADLTAEGAATRVKIQSVVDKEKENLRGFSELMRTLCQIAATHYNLNKQQADDLEDAMFSIYDDIRKTMGGAT